MRFIEVTTAGGRKVLINPDFIMCVKPSPIGNAEIYFSERNPLHLNMSYAEIVRILTGEATDNTPQE